eukprot:2794368-Pleurochrysis_carterae.AAC.1
MARRRPRSARCRCDAWARGRACGGCGQGARSERESGDAHRRLDGIDSVEVWHESLRERKR